MNKDQRVACIQMNSSGDISENLLVANALIQQAVEQEAKLIVLPEMFAYMGLSPQDKIQHKEQWANGPVQDFLSAQAEEYGVWIVGGTIPIAIPDTNHKVSATCILFNDQGKPVARYDKIHLFDVYLSSTQEKYAESDIIEAGNEIVVTKTPFGNLGLAVCYDLRFPEMFRLMLKKEVEIIAVPTAFTFTTGAAHWEVLLRARAIENLSYVIAACQEGTQANGRKTYGHSMIVNPWGEVQVCLPQNSGVILGEINHEFLQKIREDFPALAHRKKI